MRRLFAAVLAAAALGACAHAGGDRDVAARAASGESSWAPAPQRRSGLQTLASVEGDRVVVHTKGGGRRFLTGVNLGATVPGHAPGELAVDAQTYRRMFDDMRQLGIRLVRIYTIHPPRFYEALAAHNLDHPDQPLLLVQGVYFIDEERWLHYRSLYDPYVRDGFRAELADASAAVHGELQRDEMRGRAWGRWTADVSQWVAGWVIGVELDPAAVAASDLANASVPQFEGRWFRSEAGATPTERWLAEMCDAIAGHEAARGRSAPVAFVNWPTTDPLDHPDEPLAHEDMVGIDANNVVATPAWPGGTFASYHAYPYYPDFLRHEPGVAWRERSDPYAGYLGRLRDHHEGMPVLVTEVGVPSSIGSAHNGPLGRNQGGHSEREALGIDADLLHLIRDQGLGGAFLFAWVDEWFKFTWNTVDWQIPYDRRPLWHDAWTNEQWFGLFAADPGLAQTLRLGDPKGWDSATTVVHGGDGAVRELRTAHDEAYLYVRARFADDRWDDSPVTVAFDTHDGGAGALPPGMDDAVDGPTARVADTAVTVDGDGARLWVRAGIDPVAVVHGAAQGYVEVPPGSLEDGSAVWNPRRLLINRPLHDARTGETHDAELFDASHLRAGTTVPGSAAYENRSQWWRDGRDLYLRLPWAALGFADPSSRSLLVPRASGGYDVEGTTGVRLSVVTAGQDRGPRAAGEYRWEQWNTVRWNLRAKDGVDLLATAFAELSG